MIDSQGKKNILVVVVEPCPIMYILNWPINDAGLSGFIKFPFKEKKGTSVEDYIIAYLHFSLFLFSNMCVLCKKV